MQYDPEKLKNNYNTGNAVPLRAEIIMTICLMADKGQVLYKKPHQYLFHYVKRCINSSGHSITA